MIDDSRMRVDMLWNCSTLFTVAMTNKGGKMVRKLTVNEAMPMSRSARRSCSTRSSSQRKLNKASAAT